MKGDYPAKILIVDDNLDLATTISDYYLNNDLGIVPLIADDPTRVLDILAQNPDVRLVLSDFYMPKMNGIELMLSVREKYPDMQFVLMTGYYSKEIQDMGLAQGAVSFFKKPFNLDELTASISRTLDKTSDGFDGVVESVQLLDIVQLIAISQKTVALQLSTGKNVGSLFFRDGEIIHAECEKLDGEEAFYEMFNWEGGHFNLMPLVVDVKETIKLSTQGLIMEAARRQDEADDWSGDEPTEWDKSADSAPAEDDGEGEVSGDEIDEAELSDASGDVETIVVELSEGKSKVEDVVEESPGRLLLKDLNLPEQDTIDTTQADVDFIGVEPTEFIPADAETESVVMVEEPPAEVIPDDTELEDEESIEIQLDEEDLSEVESEDVTAEDTETVLEEVVVAEEEPPADVMPDDTELEDEESIEIQLDEEDLSEVEPEDVTVEDTEPRLEEPVIAEPESVIAEEELPADVKPDETELEDEESIETQPDDEDLSEIEPEDVTVEDTEPVLEDPVVAEPESVIAEEELPADVIPDETELEDEESIETQPDDEDLSEVESEDVTAEDTETVLEEVVVAEEELPADVMPDDTELEDEESVETQLDEEDLIEVESEDVTAEDTESIVEEPVAAEPESVVAEERPPADVIPDDAELEDEESVETQLDDEDLSEVESEDVTAEDTETVLEEVVVAEEEPPADVMPDDTELEDEESVEIQLDEEDLIEVESEDVTAEDTEPVFEEVVVTEEELPADVIPDDTELKDEESVETQLDEEAEVVIDDRPEPEPEPSGEEQEIAVGEEQEEESSAVTEDSDVEIAEHLIADVIPQEERVTSEVTETMHVIIDDTLISKALEKAVNHYLAFWHNDEPDLLVDMLPLELLPKSLQTHFKFRFQQDLLKVIRTDNPSYDFEDEEVIAAVQNLLSELYSTRRVSRDSYHDILRYALSFELARSIDPARATTEVLQELSNGIASKIKSLVKGLIDYRIIGEEYSSLVADISKQGDREINARTLEYLCRSTLYRLDEDQRWRLVKDSMQRILDIISLGMGSPMEDLEYNIMLNMLEAHGLAQFSDFINMTRKMGQTTLNSGSLNDFYEKYKNRNRNVDNE